MIRNCIWKLLLMFSIFGFGQGLNILGLFPHPAISHFKFFHPIMRRLAESGHTVDVVSTFPDAQPPPATRIILYLVSTSALRLIST